MATDPRDWPCPRSQPDAHRQFLRGLITASEYEAVHGPLPPTPGPDVVQVDFVGRRRLSR